MLVLPAAALAMTAVVPISAAEGTFAGLRASEPPRFGGSPLAEVGDVNGDGRVDFAVGQPSGRGVVHVVFGGAPLGRIEAAVPDVDGDGRRDLLIGAPGVGRLCSPDEGAAYVVFSRADASPVDLADLGAGGYAISG